MKYLNKYFFFSLMIFSTLFSISTMSWLTAWIGLEMNLLSILPLMKNMKNMYSSESMIKYFIIQAMASAILMFSIITYMTMKNWVSSLNLINLIVLVSVLMMKMGAAPFHFWYPEVQSGLNWEMNFTMMTWQKIAPMILLSYILSSKMNMYISIIIILSSLISSLQAMNQTCLRKIMAYSSINHLSWMISAMLNSLTIWLYYFLTYTLLNYLIIKIFNKNNILYIKQLNEFLNFKKTLKFLFMTSFLSLGGLPPFLGFFPKWMIMNQMIMNNFYSLTFFLTIFTLISLYVYVRMMFSSLSLNTQESLIKINLNMSFFYIMMNWVSMIGLFFCPLIINFL